MRDPLHWVPIRYKLALMFLSVCLLAFGVGGYMVSGSAKRALEREIGARLEFQARAYASALDDSLQLLTRRAEDFASDGYIRAHAEALGGAEDQATPRLRVELAEHLERNKRPLVPAYVGLDVVSANGRLLASVPANPGSHATGALEVARRCAQIEGPCPTNWIVPASPGEPLRMAVSTPLKSLDGQRPIGWLVAWIHPGMWIVGALRTVDAGGRGDAPGIDLRLEDSDGRSVTIGRDLTAPSGPAADSEIVRSGFGLMLDDEPSAASPASPARPGVPRIFARSYPVPTNHWSAHVELHADEALSAVEGLQSRFLAMGLALALGASLLLFFPMRFLARPILALAEAARRIQQGEFATRVKVESEDEIGDLARSFNHMADAVEERTHWLEQSAEDLRRRQAELKHERDRLDAVIGSMRDGLVVLDSDGKPVLHNRAAQPLLHMIRSQAAAARGHHLCERNDDAGSSCRDCLFEMHAPPRSCVMEIDGGVYEIHSTRLAPDESGRSARVLVSRDISDRVAQDERQIHQERLAVLGEVAAVMAHELNNPLAAINLYNQMMQVEMPPDSPLQENVAVIQRNTEACKRTIRELLNYATDTTPEIEGVDLHATLNDVATFLRPLRQRAGVELRLDIGQEPVEVSGDEVQIRQIFINLIVNAIQAMEHGGSVAVRVVPDGSHVAVEITDTGSGIPEGVREKIFRPFFTTKPRGTGTGLGLPTARRIAEMHGGTLELMGSRPGETTFRVRLRRRVEVAV
ncbi:MAG: sensor histidine kinase [Planctomycetota bacterium]